MANTKISDLTASAANLASTDVVPVVQTTGVGPVKMTGTQIINGVLAGATTNLGGSDAASPTAQKLKVQSVAAGTSNTAGADWTLQGSLSTGNAVGGGWIFSSTKNDGASGTTQGTPANIFKLFYSATANGAAIQFYDYFGAKGIFYSEGVTGYFVMSQSTSTSRVAFDTGTDGVVRVNATGSYAFSNGTNAIGTIDTAVSRPAAGVVKISNHSTGGGALQLSGYTFATLPTGAAGMIAYITDGSASYTVGSTISAGGGANKVYAYHDGTNWKALTASF